jgi:hypothetical protein
MMSSCVNQPAKSTPASLKVISCDRLKPIYLPEVIDEKVEIDVTDYNIAYDEACL